jgi:hypothetical protein
MFAKSLAVFIALIYVSIVALLAAYIIVVRV